MDPGHVFSTLSYVRLQEGDSYLQTKKNDLPRNKICCHLDFRLPTFQYYEEINAYYLSQRNFIKQP
jgi:hypothetical protein